MAMFIHSYAATDFTGNTYRSDFTLSMSWTQHGSGSTRNLTVTFSILTDTIQSQQSGRMYFGHPGK